MKVLQTIASMNATGGGTSSCTFQLFNSLYRIEPEARLLSMAPQSEGTEVLGRGTEWLVNLPYDYQGPLSVSKNIRRYLNDSDADIFHTNGLWMDVNHATCATARRKGKPYLITPHGMLYADALRRSRWKKLPLEILWYRKDILNASCIHATCDEEMRQVRAYGYKGPVAVIGNPIEIPYYISSINTTHNIPNNIPTAQQPYKYVIGYLGRLHPRKQVERIFQGLALSPNNSRFKVVVIGKGDDSYESFLRQEVDRLNLDGQVEFKGFINGKDKFEELSRMSALFVPSDLENFGMIIPEALLVNTPVMASLGTPWESLNTNRCGWWTDASPESIAKVIDEIIKLTPNDLKAMGARGAKMINDNFAADTIAAKLISLYDWISGGGPQPDFVYL